MLFAKRFSTAVAVFVILFIVLILAVAGVQVAGSYAKASAKGLAGQDSYEYRLEYQREFTKRYGKLVTFSAAGISFVSSLALSFGGVLPWCRQKQKPPRLSCAGSLGDFARPP